VFDVDAFAHALPAGCAWWEGELGAGEMIFIPEEWPVTRPEPLCRIDADARRGCNNGYRPHAVVNLQPSIATSYVTPSNPRCLASLHRAALRRIGASRAGTS
jgi:hypothetical protein